MNYEEYTTRMKALKRKPIEREHYEEIVEKAYMALLDVDKDEFCALSDKVIGAVRRLADAKESAKNAVKAADKRAEDFRRIAEKSEQDLATANATIARLQAALETTMAERNARDELVDRLLSAMPIEDVRKFIVANV